MTDKELDKLLDRIKPGIKDALRLLLKERRAVAWLDLDAPTKDGVLERGVVSIFVADVGGAEFIKGTLRNIEQLVSSSSRGKN